MNARAGAFALVAFLAAFGLVPPAVAGPPVTADAGNESVIEPCAATPPADYADPDNGTETIGWVDGYWYDEPLDLDTDDGLDQGELERMSARAMARIEAMRCLPATEGRPPIDVISRDEYRDILGGRPAGGGGSRDVFGNAMFETLLLSTNDSSIGETRNEQRGAVTAGVYNYLSKRITIVTEDPDSLLLDEPVLVHELGHAIQDQHFDVGGYERTTLDEDKATLGLLEGDIHRIEQRYRSACQEGIWNEPCVSPTQSDSDAGGNQTPPNIPNWGLFLLDYFPYSDGPSFVDDIHESGGWEAVNALYDDPPESALEVAQPAMYDTIERANATLPDRSTDGWNRVSRHPVETTNGSIEYQTVGITGIFGMFVEPTAASENREPIINGSAVQNTNEDGRIDQSDPYEYAIPETEGWRDDRLYVYENGSKTATVWRLAWENAADARPFVLAYEDLIQYRNGTAVDGHQRTYEFGAGSDYDSAVTIVPQDEEVTIVMAPSVADIQAVYPGISDLEPSLAPESAGGASSGNESVGEPGPSESGPSRTEKVALIGIAALVVIVVAGVALLDLRRW